MSCSITITSVYYNAGTLFISGNASGCLGTLNLAITGTCGTNSFFGTGQILGGTTFWVASIPITCNCSGSISITVTCPTNPLCTVNYSSPTLPCCCPSVATTVNIGHCNSKNLFIVTFLTSITIPNNCTFNFQRNFGDTTFGAVNTFTGPGTFGYTETHAYTPNSTYTSTEVAPPCGVVDTVTVSVPKCPACNSGILSFLCPAFIYAFLFSATMVLLILSIPLCLVPAPSLTAIAAGFAIAAIVLLILIYLICRKSICDILTLLPLQVVLAVSLDLLLFTFTPSCNPFSVGSILGTIAGVLAIFYLSWYLANKKICPLTICNFLSVIAQAVIIAIVCLATIAVLIITIQSPPLPLVVSIPGALFLLVLFVIILNSINSLISIEESSGNCPNYP